MVDQKEIITKNETKFVRGSIKIEKNHEQTYVFVAAISKNPTNNVLMPVNIKIGIPVTNQLYDSQTDCYYVEGVDVLQLGPISASFSISIEGNPNWRQRIPLSESVIRNYLSNEQRKILKSFRIKYNRTQHDYIFLQAIMC